VAIGFNGGLKAPVKALFSLSGGATVTFTAATQ
jgi:hypothetical protein